MVTNGRSESIQQRVKMLALVVVPLIFLVASSSAQSTAYPYLGVFGGAGITNASGPVHGGFQFGADFEAANPWSHSHPIFPVGYLVEGGYIGPVNSFAAGSAILSLNYLGKFNFSDQPDPRLTPFLTGGYTHMFGTGNAVNFGGGIDCRISNTTSFRFEVRDYRRAGGPAEHNVAIRIGLVRIALD